MRDFGSNIDKNAFNVNQSANLNANSSRSHFYNGMNVAKQISIASAEAGPSQRHQLATFTSAPEELSINNQSGK